eukprot:CAMPEP_0170512972 /NCGR_PEP_ID=MMETSP0208-20121228/67144_1 /TAXON_ID=197538 /ORGANISM="Strombidium inclinatum, Strain S3" /LENGTH=204 /DNA_ID=CAMNT_0010796657 /DNA_START=500 /DNA_END=1114 /DNA_ORIENTATION=-
MTRADSRVRLRELIQQRTLENESLRAKKEPVKSPEEAQQQLIKTNLLKHYSAKGDYYKARMTSDIMYNEPRHVVSVFKDYLIYDDFSEYLKRFYSLKESTTRLVKVFTFYHKHSKPFPNFVSLPQEGRFIFKNVERKQWVLDNKKRKGQESSKKKKPVQDVPSVLFRSDFYNNLTEFNEELDPIKDLAGAALEPYSPPTVRAAP